MLSPRLLAALATGAAALLLRPALAQRPDAVPTPRSHLGFEVGADRALADWAQITGYFSKLAAASPLVRVDTLGRTTNGLPMVLATFASPENMRRLDEIRRAQARLADPRTLSAAEERRLIAEQPMVVMVQCNIHSSEIASSQMAMELGYRLATNDTLRRALDDVVVLLVPSANPDGQQMITDWYRKQLGTKWEGGPLPWLYHTYTGHDNNRDWYMVTQKETRLLTDLLYRTWFPEVMYDVHQQGNEGMRLTVPPYVDPIDPNIDPVIVREIGHIGAEMSLALEERGKSGVGDGATYDLWWHGGARSTPYRHNMVGLLTEAASVKIATPITQDTSKLRGHPRGLPKYERRMNFPNPWPGGSWRLRDIVDYELIAAEALVRMTSQQREQYVRNFVRLGRRQVELGSTQGPRAYVIPAEQHDPYAAAKLAQVLRVGGVELLETTRATTVAGQRIAAGSVVVSMAQPYRAHAKDLLEVQRFPKMEQYPGGPPERPYDVAGWTLPLQMGVRVMALDSAVPAAATRALGERPLPTCARAEQLRNTACYAQLSKRVGARGSRAARAALPSRMPRVALYKPWTANMDEGWTRWVLEQFAFPYTTVTDSAIKAGGLRGRFDAVIVPDMSLRDAREGMRAEQVPPEYAGGLGEAGLAQLRAFAEGGGTVVTLDHAAEIATAALGVDVRRVTVPSRSDDREQPAADRTAGDSAATRRAVPLYAPGSIFRVLVDTRHPVAAGMPDTAAVYFTNSTTFDLAPGSAARVIARYPAAPGDVLLSGYLQGAEAIAGKAAAVEARVGRGRVVMFGFRPQYRGQSYGTFRLLFNALLTSVK
jgi:hypothetical protein